MQGLLTLLLVGSLLGTGQPAQSPTLVQAAKDADWRVVRILLEEGTEVDETASDGSTALHWASYWDEVGVAELLISRGANPSAANDLGATPLWSAGLNSSSSMVRLLLQAGADPDAALLLGETVLMTAARSGSADVVEQLLVAGANPNRASAREQTALMWAAAQGHSDAVELLLAHGAAVHVRTETWSELHKTDPAQASHPDYQMWVERGGNTALMFAIQSGDLSSTKLLVAAGANVNFESASGVSATTLAAHADHNLLVEFLLENGADPNVEAGGYRALHAAILRGNKASVEALLAFGADPNAPLRAPTTTRRQSLDFFFHPVFVEATPFWLAARFVQPEIMRALSNAGADPFFTHDVEYWRGVPPDFLWEDEGPTTALMAAVGMGGRVTRGYTTPAPHEREVRALEAVRIAVELGLDLEAQNSHGRTALEAAYNVRYDSIVDFLIENGADDSLR